jgi:PAS domain S-box-containing protein
LPWRAAPELEEGATLTATAPTEDRASLDAIGFGIYRIDGEGRCRFINPAGLAMLGYEASEVLGHNMHELIHHSHPDGSPYPQSACPLLAAQRGARPVRLFNEVLWRKDGSFFAAEYSAWPVTEDGAANGSVVTFVDSRDQSEAQRRLALQVTASRILTGAADLPTVLGQLLAAIGGALGCQAGLFWNLDRRERLLDPEAGWAAPGIDAALRETAAPLPLDQGSGLPGRVWQAGELVALDDVAASDATAPARLAAAAGLPVGLAFPVNIGRRMLGVVEMFRRAPVELDDAFRDNVAALGQHIGQYLRRKRAEEALKEREEEFRALADNIAQLAWMADAGGAVYWLNKRWYEFTGATQEESQGQDWSRFLHADHAEQVVARFRAAIEGGVAWEDTFPLRGRDGGYRWFLSRALPIRDEQDRIVRWFGTNTDITEQRRIEQELEAAKEQAEEANRAKSQFIANMSHELRTPLSAVIGYAEMLAEEVEDLGPEAASFREDLGTIEASARHLLSLISGVLDISKIEAGRMEVEAEAFEVGAVLDEVAATVQSLVAKRDNRLVVEPGPELGAMYSDVVKLRQCLFNLLSNAAKFTERGEIHLAARREGDRVTFTVSDSGIGMDAVQLTRLFQRFSQADASTTRRFGGTGLGLAITKAFAEMLGGGITVESRQGQGTTFTLWLPADLRAPVGPEGEGEVHADGSTATRVLVIDDDPHMRDLMTRFLRREGFGVAVAPGGATGLRLARELHPSAILLDVMMPSMDGWTVLAELKADPEVADIPVIIISMIREKGLAYSLGAADYFTKPIQWTRLKQVVERFRNDAEPGAALVVEPDGATREELRAIMSDEGWQVAAAADGVEAVQRLAERRPDLLLINLELPEGEAFALLRRLRNEPHWRTIPVIALAEGGLPESERARLRGQVRQVIRTGEDSSDELVAELRRLSAGRAAASSGTASEGDHG